MTVVKSRNGIVDTCGIYFGENTLVGKKDNGRVFLANELSLEKGHYRLTSANEINYLYSKMRGC